MGMTFYEAKGFRIRNTTYCKDKQHTIPVKLTFSTYTDRGPDYEQRTRYARLEDIESLELVKCARCGCYMDGGKTDLVSKEHRCYACARELLLEEIIFGKGELLEQYIKAKDVSTTEIRMSDRRYDAVNERWN